jgi:hypothetical membrane protein
MRRDNRLLFGPLAAILLAVGVVGLPAMHSGYDGVRQTVSEIGEVGSPAQLPFTLLLCAVAACILVFALGLRAAAKQAGHSALAAYVTACMAISAAGVGIFSTPHPLHNVFGLSELVGYQAPLALALTWRRDPAARGLVAFCWLMFVLVWLALGLNMVPMFSHGALWAQLKPYYGVAQRSLFAAWFVWCAVTGWLLFQRRR